MLGFAATANTIHTAAYSNRLCNSHKPTYSSEKASILFRIPSLLYRANTYSVKTIAQSETLSTSLTETAFDSSVSGNKQALISLSDKRNLTFLANGLQGLGTQSGVAHIEAVLSPKTRAFRQPICTCLNSDESELASDSQPTNTSLTEATIDIQLPRRSLLLQFTCNACGERTERLINRLAYDRGTVFVQCAGCLKHHRLVDNLGLVVEYDLRKDANEDLNADQV